jgi:hypothetical protein
MSNNFKFVPVREDTHRTIKVLAAQNGMDMYQVVGALVEKGEHLIGQ